MTNKYLPSFHANMSAIACNITFEEFRSIGVAGATAKLKEAGFVFAREACPFELQAPSEIMQHLDGVLYLQFFPRAR